MDCAVCCNPFDDKDHRLRNLECGHTFCTTCLKGIHCQAELECPECRHKQNDVDEVSALPVAFGVLRAVEAARGEVAKGKEQDEWEAPLLILPGPRKDLQEDGKESLANEGAVDLEVLKKSYRNVLWSKIYFCGENLEELKDYEKVLEKASENARCHMRCLKKILESRQSLIQFLREETEKSKREREAIEGKKKELFARKERLDCASGFEDTEDFWLEKYVDRRQRLWKFLEMDKEALEIVRSFTSNMCRNDKRLIRILEPLDAPEFDLARLFENTMKLD